MKIIFLVGSLDMGGVERGVAKLSNYWVSKQHIVTVVTLTDCQNDFYNLDKKINRIGLNLMEPRKNILQKISLQLRRMYAFSKIVMHHKPDIVLSFATDCNILALETAWMHATPVIISERNNFDKKIIKKLPTLLRRLLYPFAKKIVFVSQGVSDSFDWIRKEQKYTILNALEISDTSLPVVKINKIVALGRLVDAKGFDILIRAFSKISFKYPDWSLTIFGDGPLRTDLQNLIDTQGTKDRINLAGYTQDSISVLKSAGIFILSSRYEGFPNVLMEAMSVGAPCISFNCPSGPNEMLTDHYNGLLIPPEDEDALVKAIEYMIEHPEVRQKMGKNALEINKRLNIEKITAEWEEVIQTLLPSKKL